MIPELENLVKIGQLKREATSPAELEGLRASGEARLMDSRNAKLALASRFDLAYNAAHALALAALHGQGYRSEHRHTVFSALPHTLGLDTPGSGSCSGSRSQEPIGHAAGAVR